MRIREDVGQRNATVLQERGWWRKKLSRGRNLIGYANATVEGDAREGHSETE